MLKELRSTLANWLDPDAFRPIGSYRPVVSGVRVTQDTAMRVTAVFACVRVLAWTLASLPLPVYRRLTPRGKERNPKHPLYKILHGQPNSEMTSFSLRSVMMAHLALWGNAYAEIEYNRRGDVIALWLVPAWRVDPQRGREGKAFYKVNLPDGTTENVPGGYMLHIMGLGTDGMRGLSPIGLAAETLGLTVAAEQFGARFFGQGANVGGVLEHPGRLSEEAHRRLRDGMQEKYEGLGRSHRLMLLEEGMSYQRVGIPPNEAQFIELRKFQLGDIARLYGIQPHKIGDLERATFGNIEHQGIEFVVDTLRPWLVNWEQEIQRKLFVENDDHFAEFVVDGLLRGDIQSRYSAYATARQWGWASANDVRELENQNPLPGEQGDVYLIPMNMMPAEQALEPPEPVTPSAPAEPDDARAAPRRETRSAKSRSRVRKSYQRIFEAAAARIVKREEADIMRQARKVFAERNIPAFLDWLAGFYKSHEQYVREQILPPMLALAEAIQAATADEIDASAGMTPELERFVREYVATYIARHIGKSKARIENLLAGAFEDDADEIEMLQAGFDEWREEVPPATALDETVRLSSAVFVFAVGAAGFTKLIWRAIGSKTCPFCQQLNGKVVGIEAPFIAAGEAIEADDGSEMKVYGPKRHPPIHQGCVCDLEAST